MLNFDENGYLIPFEEIETDINITKSTFTFNEHRTNIWQHFEAFILELQNMLQTPFSVWLNGSFTTQKPLPNDLDCVVFIDFEMYEILEKELQKFKSLKYKKENFLDIYFVKIYPKDHKKKIFEDFDLTEWFFLFTKTRTKNIKKGFLKLKF